MSFLFVIIFEYCAIIAHAYSMHYSFFFLHNRFSIRIFWTNILTYYNINQIVTFKNGTKLFCYLGNTISCSLIHIFHENSNGHSANVKPDSLIENSNHFYAFYYLIHFCTGYFRAMFIQFTQLKICDILLISGKTCVHIQCSFNMLFF